MWFWHISSKKKFINFAKAFLSIFKKSLGEHKIHERKLGLFSYCAIRKTASISMHLNPQMEPVRHFSSNKLYVFSEGVANRIREMELKRTVTIFAISRDIPLLKVQIRSK